MQTGHWGLLESHKQEEAEAMALLPLWPLEPPQPWPVHSWGTGHRGLCSLNMTEMFGLNRAENHKTKNKFAIREGKSALLSRFYFKTFIQASLWFQAPPPKGIKLNWSLMAWKVAFWIKAHPVTKQGGEGICNSSENSIWSWTLRTQKEPEEYSAFKSHRGAYDFGELGFCTNAYLRGFPISEE